MVNRISKKTFIKDTKHFRENILFWGSKFDTFVILESNNHIDKYSSFDFMALEGVNSYIDIVEDKGAFDKFINFKNKTKDWIAGYFSYDLKNDVEELSSKNLDNLNFSSIYFFQPKKIFTLRGNILECSYIEELADDIDKDLREIYNLKKDKYEKTKFYINRRISKKDYVDIFYELKSNISRGNIYEINFCQEFFGEEAYISPERVFNDLNALSCMPFASFCKFYDKYVISLSPERFLRKKGDKIISQPIKGTASKSDNKIEEEENINILKNDMKEIKENIMTVDMVRNDLSKTANNFSVKVEQLCGIYSYNQINHMVSTVSSRVAKNIESVDIIKSAFPMASMTGVPKNKAMEIIEKYESTKRGLYSGALGYFSPQGDFDFNVVIRTILYDNRNKYLSYSVGSAITDLSCQDKEYEECLLKAKFINEFFGNK